MPRLSLYKPEKGNDYKFIDRQVSEMFQIGGTELYLHKYLGVNTDEANATAAQPHYDTLSPTNIQDLLFLENRDRKYEPEIYRVRGVYNVQNIDFNLSQFGLFVDNDTVYLTVHINDWIKLVGRKPLSGDVLEFPHLRDEFALNDFSIGLPRYYVIEDVGRASEGFSITWWPHLYRLKLKKIIDGQQFADILDQKATNADGTESDTTLRDLLSTKGKEYEINDAMLAQAEADAPLSGYETRQFYTLAVDVQGNPILRTTDEDDIDASNVNTDSSEISGRALRKGYTGYLVSDGTQPNDPNSVLNPFGHGIQFPAAAVKDDFFLRTDFMPNRLFRFNGNTWVKVEDNLRMTMTNNDQRQTQKTSFINNTNTTGKNQIGRDYVTAVGDTSTIQTNVAYADGVFATAYINDVKINAVTSEGLGGNTLITLSNTAVAGDQIQWKLFASSVPERQALSKAIRYKPEADV
jgi:hypothetical protein